MTKGAATSQAFALKRHIARINVIANIPTNESH